MIAIAAKVSVKIARMTTTDAGEGGGPGFPAGHARELADTGVAVMAGADNAVSGLATLVSSTRSSMLASTDPEIISAHCDMSTS
jgi:hypothetical protein